MSEWKDFIPICEKCGASNPTTTVVFREVSKQSLTKAYICESCEKLMPKMRNGLELKSWIENKV